MLSKITKIDELIRREGRPKPISSAFIDISQDEEHGINKVSYLGPTMHFKGDILLDENLRIEGEVEGTVRIRGKQLSIGKRAVVKAEIHASTVDVRGKVEGDIYGDELVHVYATAVVDGSIHCKRIVVEDGARFNGQFRTAKESTDSSEPKETSKSSGSKESTKSSNVKSTLKSVGS